MDSRWRKVFFAGAALAVAILGVITGRAAPPEAGAWRVWLEPKFMHPAAGSEMPGARRTQFAAGLLGDGGLEGFPEAEFKKLGMPWKEFFERARANAAEDLAKTATEYVRNRKKVIEYAEVRSTEGLMASAVLAPKFGDQFNDTLGPELLVVVPNRNTAYVFPKLATRYQDYAALVLSAYRETSWPVSLEIFEWSAGGLRAIGAFADPSRE